MLWRDNNKVCSFFNLMLLSRDIGVDLPSPPSGYGFNIWPFGVSIFEYPPIWAVSSLNFHRFLNFTKSRFKNSFWIKLIWFSSLYILKNQWELTVFKFWNRGAYIMRHKLCASLSHLFLWFPSPKCAICKTELISLWPITRVWRTVRGRIWTLVHRLWSKFYES